jgi:hypothetical protein
VVLKVLPATSWCVVVKHNLQAHVKSVQVLHTLTAGHGLVKAAGCTPLHGVMVASAKWAHCGLCRSCFVGCGSGHQLVKSVSSVPLVEVVARAGVH